MKKSTIVGSIAAGVLSLGAVGSFADTRNVEPNSTFQEVQSVNTTVESEFKPAPKPTCDGISITSSCIHDGVSYRTYIYYPAVTEKSHTEQATTYKREVVDYCTLCNDGTYSPSCATGRGACSHHGGVAEWDAPRYANVPVYTNKTVIDVSAKDAYYEKVAE